MAPLVWVTTGVAIWHFSVFLPDRWWAGIVGALIGSVAGALVTGAIAQAATGAGLGETGLETVLFALPGAIAGMALVYAIGVRQEEERLAEPA